MENLRLRKPKRNDGTKGEEEREREGERGKGEEAVEKHLFFFIDSRINRT